MKMRKKSIKLLVIMVLVLSMTSVIVLAVNSMTQSAENSIGKDSSENAGSSTSVTASSESNTLEDHAALIADLKKIFGLSSSELDTFREQNGSWEKTAWILIKEKAGSLLTDDEYSTFFNNGFTALEIERACEYSVMCGKTPGEILLKKSKADNRTFLKKKDKNGKEQVISVDNSSKQLDELAKKVKIDLIKFAVYFGLQENQIAEMKAQDFTDNQIYEVAVLCINFGKKFEDVYKDYSESKNFLYLRSRYSAKTDKIDVVKKYPVSTDPKAEFEKLVKKTYKITDEDIALGKKYGINKINDLAEAKKAAKKCHVDFEKVLKTKEGKTNWDSVVNELGGDR